MKRKKVILSAAFAVAAVLLFNYANFANASAKVPKDDLYNQIEIFSDAITAVQGEYVDKVTPKDIIYGALKGMLASLDPYSQFMDPDTFQELQVETEGHFGGLGIEITIRDNLLTIITPLDDTPAQKAGLKSMDRIVKIDDKITKDFTLTEAVKMMRGEPGTDVTLTIMREDEEELKDYTITRDIINIKAVRKAELIEDNIGYIKLTDFSETTKKDLEKALQELSEKGMNSLIFDLRNNPGGLLLASVETASEFLATGKLVVSTKGRDQNQTAEYRATGKTNFKDIPLIVMVNGGSASASEIVAGAIQDHKRGIILGTKSFGKGSVQTVIPLRDGSALRLTTAKYYTPSGKSINEIGIIPDVTIELDPEAPIDTAKQEKDKDKENEVFKKLKDNGTQKEEPPQDKEGTEKQEQAPQEPPKENEILTNDSQLRAAVNLMKGIKIYENIKMVN